MSESYFDIQERIRQLTQLRDELQKGIASSARTKSVYEEELAVMEVERERLKKLVKKAQDKLDAHNALISKFRQEREEELNIMFKYGEKSYRTYERQGYKFLNVMVVNDLLCPEHSKNINLFFHWIEDRRGEWMTKRKEWTMKDLSDAIYRVEQDYEYDSRGR